VSCIAWLLALRVASGLPYRRGSNPFVYRELIKAILT
jgi:hypothetical protein